MLNGILEKAEMEALFRRRSAHYDFTANLYYLVGFRAFRYRRLAVEALRLRPGDTVLELGCGTGLNFTMIRRRIGPEGRIIAIDLSEAMLRRARDRVVRNGWENVELVEADAASYCVEAQVDAVLSTFAVTLIQDSRAALERSAETMRAGARMVLLDVRSPRRWPRWLVRLGSITSQPFGVTVDVLERRPWEMLPPVLSTVQRQALYFGIAYLVVAEAGRKSNVPLQSAA